MGTLRTRIDRKSDAAAPLSRRKKGCRCCVRPAAQRRESRRRLSDQTKFAQVRHQRGDRIPRQNWRVLPLIRRTGWQFVRPPAATHQGQQRALVQPRQMDLRFGARSPADHDAGITGQRHQQVARIAHATGKHNRCRPVRRHDAQHKPVRRNRVFRRNTGRRTAASTYHRNAQRSQRLPRLSGKFVGRRAGFGAAKHTDLRFAVRDGYVDGLSFVLCGDRVPRCGERRSGSSRVR